MSYVGKEEWVEIRKGGDFRALGERFAVSPVIARILRNREITTDEEIHRFLYGTLEDLDDPQLLDQAADAARLIHESVRNGRRIRIIGDYDVDGICSTYILYDTLVRDGARIDYEVPDRIRDGFGLNLRLIEDAHADGVDTILTCDNGISANEAVARAKQLGMSVILTDHHEPNYREREDGTREWLLPEADVIVDPKKPGCHYPNKELCGAGVAWKLMHIYECLFMNGSVADPESSDSLPGGSGQNRVRPVYECPVAMEHLPFAAIATVADVMKLTGENRIIVRKGLLMLPDSPNAGIQALLSQTGILGKKLNCYDIGFVLGPCLNAGGRLDTAMKPIALLLEKDPSAAMHIASELCALNSERKNMTEDGRKEASARIEGSSMLKDRILIVYLPGIHESVAGIIASRIKDTYSRPVIILTDSDDPDILKGSGRSIEACNLFEALTSVSDLFVKYGGHAMAAGVSLRRDRLEELRLRINESCSLTDSDLVKKVRIDMRLPLSCITEDFTGSLQILEPFGTGNSAPLFAQSNLRVLSMRILGQNRNTVRFLLDDEGTRMEALWFGDASVMEDFIRQKAGEETLARLKIGAENDLRLSVAYHPAVNEYRGVRTIQIRIVHYR